MVVFHQLHSQLNIENLPGACHDRNSNPVSCECKPGILPLSYSAIPHSFGRQWQSKPTQPRAHSIYEMIHWSLHMWHVKYHWVLRYFLSVTNSIGLIQRLPGLCDSIVFKIADGHSLIIFPLSLTGLSQAAGLEWISCAQSSHYTHFLWIVS